MKRVSLLRLLDRCAYVLGSSELAVMHLIDDFEEGRICAAAARRLFWSSGNRCGLWKALLIDAKRFNCLLSALTEIDPEAAKSWKAVDLAELQVKYYDYFAA